MKLQAIVSTLRPVQTIATIQTLHPRGLRLTFFPVRRLLLPVIFGLQVFASVADESSRERQDRVYREEQRSRDNDAYLGRWRGSQSQYAAIAYSKSTDRWGYGVGCATLTAAKQEALRRCGANDASILCWAQNGSYCALAHGPNSHGWAFAPTSGQAQAKALANANKIAPGSRIVVCIRGNQ